MGWKKLANSLLVCNSGHDHRQQQAQGGRYAAALLGHGFTGLCTENHMTAGVSKWFFTSMNSWGWQGAVCSLQWPLDDRATLRAIHSLISPCPLLQKGLSSIKVKINGWKRDSKSLLWVRRCLLCGQGNCNQAEQKHKSWLQLMGFPLICPSEGDTTSSQ